MKRKYKIRLFLLYLFCFVSCFIVSIVVLSLESVEAHQKLKGNTVEDWDYLDSVLILSCHLHIWIRCHLLLNLGKRSFQGAEFDNTSGREDISLDTVNRTFW